MKKLLCRIAKRGLISAFSFTGLDRGNRETMVDPMVSYQSDEDCRRHICVPSHVSRLTSRTHVGAERALDVRDDGFEHPAAIVQTAVDPGDVG